MALLQSPAQLFHSDSEAMKDRKGLAREHERRQGGMDGGGWGEAHARKTISHSDIIRR